MFRHLSAWRFRTGYEPRQKTRFYETDPFEKHRFLSKSAQNHRFLTINRNQNEAKSNPSPGRPNYGNEAALLAAAPNHETDKR